MDKKALGPVVAISLLIIVSVVSIIGFQSWYQSYSQTTFTNVETKEKSQNIEIDSIREGILYIKNNKVANYTLNTIKVGDTNCNIGQNLSLGINAIDINNCLTNTGTNDITIVTNKEIIEKKLFVKEITELAPICSNVTTGLVGLWHLDDKVYDDNFNTEIDLTKWTSYGNTQIENGRIKGTTGTSAYSSSGVHSSGKMMFEGDFDVQIDFDSSPWVGIPSNPNQWEFNLEMRVNGYAYQCRYKKTWSNTREYNTYRSDGIDGGYFAVGGHVVTHTFGKLRMIRTGNTFKCYYLSSGSWIEFGSLTHNNILGSAYPRAHLHNALSGDIIQGYLDNFIVNKGETINDTTNTNHGILKKGDPYFADYFSDTNINSNIWNIIGSSYISNGKLVTTTTAAPLNSQGVNTANKMTFPSDFDVQIDYDISSWSGNPPSEQWKAQIVLTSTTNYYCYVERLPAGTQRYHSWESGVATFNTIFPAAPNTGKLRMVRTGNNLDCYYWNGAWVKYASRISNNILGDGYLTFYTYNSGAGSSITTYFDNFQVNLGEINLSGEILEYKFDSGKIDNTYDFDGINDYINIGNQADLELDTFTISLWFKTKRTTQILFTLQNQNYQYTTQASGTHIYTLPNGSISVRGFGDQGVSNRYKILDTLGIYQNDTWHNLIVMQEPGNLKIYLDNELKAEDTNWHNTLHYDGPSRKTLIGAMESNGIKSFFKGSIDDISLYNRTLTLSEIQEIYSLGNQGKPICDP